jgi:CDP-paratose 2-epimerase
VLEAARLSGDNPIVVYASTNKVYGGMEDVAVVELPTRYAYRDLPAGVSEAQPLDFHSPYGCSKGAGDAYTRDYHRIYGLPTVVLRQSCIYGERQMGMEDQGWVAWFALAAIFGLPMTIFGDGKQVRDLLHIDDLLDAFELVVEHIDAARGQVYNLGGGAGFSVSIWREFRPLLEAALGRPLPEPEHAPWRPGDQRIFVADCAKALVDLGWAPRVPPGDGLARLTRWIADNAAMFEQLLGLPSATR